MWIEEFRERHGLDRWEFARRVRVLGAMKRPGRPIGCSEKLVYYLEMMKAPRTHPTIANLIAEACGATPEERDMIVDPKWRGTWKGDGVPKILNMAVAKRRRMTAKVALPLPGKDLELIRMDTTGSGAIHFPKGKAVVKIDTEGRVVARYASMTHAAVENNQSLDMVAARVNREILREFALCGWTYRLASEWDMMSDVARRMDLQRVRRSGDERRRRD